MNSTRTETQTAASSVVPLRRHRRVNVVGYDGADNGRNLVEAAARRVNAGDRLIIVHALRRGSTDSDRAERYDRICQQMLSELDPGVLDGIDYELRVVDGPPAQVLMEVALHAQADAIVIGTRRSPTRLGQRTIRSQLEAGHVPIEALFGSVEQESHPAAAGVDRSYRTGYDSFPASDPPSSWSGPPRPSIREDP